MKKNNNKNTKMIKKDVASISTKNDMISTPQVKKVLNKKPLLIIIVILVFIISTVSGTLFYFFTRHNYHLIFSSDEPISQTNTQVQVMALDGNQIITNGEYGFTSNNQCFSFKDNKDGTGEFTLDYLGKYIGSEDSNSDKFYVDIEFSFRKTKISKRLNFVPNYPLSHKYVSQYLNIRNPYAGGYIYVYDDIVGDYKDIFKNSYVQNLSHRYFSTDNFEEIEVEQKFANVDGSSKALINDGIFQYFSTHIGEVDASFYSSYGCELDMDLIFSDYIKYDEKINIINEKEYSSIYKFDLTTSIPKQYLDYFFQGQYFFKTKVPEIVATTINDNNQIIGLPSGSTVSTAQTPSADTKYNNQLTFGSANISSDTDNVTFPSFLYDNDKNIYIPESIDDGQFFDNNALLTGTLKILGVKTIGNQAFSNCSNLKEIFIGEGVETINQSFYTGLGNVERIVLPYSLKDVVDGGFSGFFTTPLPNGEKRKLYIPKYINSDSSFAQIVNNHDYLISPSLVIGSFDFNNSN